MASVTGLRVIVAGAATGVGAGTAKLLAARGAKVVVADINIAAAENVGAEITSSGGDAIVVEFDLSDEQSIKALIEKGTEWLGGLDSLLNIGADLSPQNLGNDKSVLDMDAAVWHRTFQVNTTGYALTTKYALPHLKKAGGGTIINISSVSSLANPFFYRLSRQSMPTSLFEYINAQGNGHGLHFPYLPTSLQNFVRT